MTTKLKYPRSDIKLLSTRAPSLLDFTGSTLVNSTLTESPNRPIILKGNKGKIMLISPQKNRETKMSISNCDAPNYGYDDVKIDYSATPLPDLPRCHVNPVEFNSPVFTYSYDANMNVSGERGWGGAEAFLGERHYIELRSQNV